ncbi:MAG: hypothetical protein H7276_17870, partial [Caulobacter sp.]|nr:hypothetical protein [Vitreoscilla sp.]
MGIHSSPPSAPGAEPRAAPAAIERQIEFERITTLYAIGQPMLVGGLAFSALLGLLLAPSVSPALLATWLGLKMVLLVARIVDSRLFLRDRHRQLRQGAWRNRFFVGTVLDSFTWGLLTVMFLPTGDAATNGVMVAGMVGVASAGVLALSAHRVASGAALILVLGPLIEQQALAATPMEHYTAATLLVYAAILFLEPRSSHRRFTDSMRLRFENAAIADERHRALVYAEHSNAAKTRFLASVSHELRTPLNGIIGMTQLVAVESLCALQRQRLDVLRHSAEHLVTVIG